MPFLDDPSPTESSTVAVKPWPLGWTVPLVLLGFAANSLLCRAALSEGSADPATFTTVRLMTGCAALMLIVRIRKEGFGRPRLGSSLALVAYAFGFSWAYGQVTTGTGALLLFGAVQVAMLLVARLQGETLTWRKGLGALFAFGGLLVLCAPTASAPPWQGALSMLLAGIAWGAYSLLGRGSTRPVADTAASFLGAALLSLPLLGFPLLSAGSLHATPKALLLAIASGTLASGAAYSLWYAVLPRLGAARAAVFQLAVRLIAAAGGLLLLGEVPGLPWFASALLIVSGIALAAKT